MTATQTPIDIQQTINDFHRDGFAMIPQFLNADQAAELRDKIDHVFDNPQTYGGDAGNINSDIVLVRLFETDPAFRDMLVQEPAISMAEAILGDDCHIIANNAVRNGPGQAIDFFHVDDAVEFPVAAGMDRHDPRLQMPIQRMTIQIMLTDVLVVEDGPTQFVPTSHYSGQNPPPNDPSPEFEGKPAQSIFCRAGDAYLHNGQTWHRGAPNLGQKTRYLLQMSFGRRYIAQRFYPFINYRMPPHVLDGASDRLQRVLGVHPHAAYG